MNPKTGISTLLYSQQSLHKTGFKLSFQSPLPYERELGGRGGGWVGWRGSRERDPGGGGRGISEAF